MASRQRSGEAAAGVVVLLGQIFSIVLALAAMCPVLAGLPRAGRAAYDRCGLAAAGAALSRRCGSCCVEVLNHIFERPRAKMLGGRGSIAACSERAWWSQRQTSLPARLLALPCSLAQTAPSVADGQHSQI